MQLLRRPLVWVGIVGVFAGGAGVAYATQFATSASTTVIKACVKKNGTIRLVDGFDECDKKNEEQISWNVQGVKGDTGPRGLQGPIGQTGPAGAPGADGKDGAGVLSTSLALGDVNCVNGGSQFESPNATTYACNGADGKNGKDGADGTNGTNGTNGVDGTNGTNGTNGTSFAGSYTSPNGKYKLRITNTGIFLSGPGGFVTVERTRVRVSDGTPWFGKPQ
jgi:Collagen triple helix repeat (20 copies).